MLLTPSFTGDILIIGIVLLIACHCVNLYNRSRWRVIDPLNAFWAGILICYVQEPIIGGDVFISWHGDGIFEKTLFAALFGLVFVILGYETTYGPRLAMRLPQPPAKLSSSKLLPASLLFIGVGICGYAYVIHLSGGLHYWLSVGRGGTDLTRVQGYLPELAQALPAGVMLLLFRARLHRISALGNLLAWVVAGLMWFWFLYLGSRSRLISFTIVMAAAYYLPARKNPKIWVAAVLFMFLYVAVTFQDYRENFTDLSFHIRDIDKRQFLGKILPESLGGDHEAKKAMISRGSEFNCNMAVVELVPRKVPYNFGYGFLEIFTRPIPRSIWPNKRYPHMEAVQGVLREADLSEAFVEAAQNQELLMGPAFCFVGHWYYVAGFVGLIIGGIFTGVLLRGLRAYFDLGRDNQGMIIIYPLLVAVGFFEAASTPLYWVFFSLPFILLLFLAVLFACRTESSYKSPPGFHPAGPAARPRANRRPVYKNAAYNTKARS